MDKTVYILGAGFSAPLGLPVMTNFLEMSKDMYFKNMSRYKDFPKVFESIDQMHKTKSYYSTDLFNIEEILSILEMRDLCGYSKNRSKFIHYLIDVIEYYTPTFSTPNRQPGNWYDHMFSSNREYFWFVACIFSLQVLGMNMSNLTFELQSQRAMSYGIITLNYDLILENIIEYIKNNFNCNNNFLFEKSINSSPRSDSVYLSKLHGSIDSKVIIPPTWNKSVKNNEIKAFWKLAYKLLSEANNIRILGYSLPASDTYIKYLLRVAIIESENLKKIDVICLDQDSTVKNRYDDFIHFKNYRFKSENIESYLELNHNLSKNPHRSRNAHQIIFSRLEAAHEQFMNQK